MKLNPSNTVARTVAMSNVKINRKGKLPEEEIDVQKQPD